MVFFIYENRSIESFEQFHEIRNKERKSRLFKEFSIPEKYPKIIKSAAKRSNELRDYLHYIKLGGAESPELMREILMRSSKIGGVTTPESNAGMGNKSKAAKVLSARMETR